MDTEQIKQLAMDVNNVAEVAFQSGKEHTVKPLLIQIEGLEVACRLARHELQRIKSTKNSYALAMIELALSPEMAATARYICSHNCRT